MTGAASNAAKRRRDAANYTQVKVSVPTGLATAFKAQCISEGVSMAGEISGFMTAKIGGGGPAKPPVDVSSRRRRRNALKKLIPQIEGLLDAEQRYMDAIPENLQGSRHYDAAEETVAALEEALEILQTAY